MHMFQVDAFAERPFTGNPAAVLVVEDWPAEELMQAIAEENNLAETAFARPRPDGEWDLRWFTPAHEVDFCGHATLATAHVLFSTGRVAAVAVFHTRVGALRVTQEGAGYLLDLPRVDPDPLARLPEVLAPLFPDPSLRLFRSFENVFVDLGSAAAVKEFRPDLQAISGLGRMGLAITGQGAAGGRADFVSRYFAPGAGIPEDPVTGSIHATLVPYWAARLGRDRLCAHQASRRGGWLDCRLTTDRVLLAGPAVTVMEARLLLP